MRSNIARVHKKIRRAGWRRIVSSIVAIIAAFGFLTLTWALLWAMTVDIPSIDSFHNRKVAQSTKVYDRTGKVLLYDVHGAVRRTEIPFTEISPGVKNATVAIEDAEFYQHYGIKPTSIIRAVFANIQTGSFGQGGSTITQQVVKNALLTPEKTITRKIKEWILAVRLERMLNKEDILSIYLNETPYGGTLYGVEEASRYFFGKSARDVTLAEAAYLAALPQAPTYYSPYGNHRDALEARKNLVLKKMLENGFITEDQYTEANNEEVVFSKNDENGIRAPHFVFFVREYLEQKYGPDVVSQGGLTVITTLDWDLQQHAEQIIHDGALKNAASYNAENAGLVALDPKTGHILAMVGSRDYFDETIDGKYNVTVAERQPGSSFKPFVYAAAFEKGYNPDTVVFDVPTQFSANCSPADTTSDNGCYAPGNYDDTFRGPMTLRDALAQSVNIPAVKVLYLVGINDALTMAKRLGLTTLTRPIGYYGLPLVLGGGEVSLLEMVSAYGTFAYDGVHQAHTGVLKVTDPSGLVLEEYTENPTNVLDPNIARMMSDVLSDDTARIPAFGVGSALVVSGHDVAVKTGTTNDYRDAWIIGYTPNIVVGVWAGNNNNTPMEKRVAGFIVAPLWNKFMSYALPLLPDDSFVTPTEITRVDGAARILYGDWSGNGSGVHSILYWVNKDNPTGPRPANPANDPQYEGWEYGVRAWTGNTTSGEQTITGGVVAPIQSTFSITTPSPGTHVAPGTPVTVSVSNPFGSDLQSVSYTVNGVYVGSVNQAPFSITTILSAPGVVGIGAVGRGNMGEVTAQTSVVVGW